MTEYDSACRRLAKIAPIDLFRWLIDDFDVHLRFMGWEDARGIPFPGEPERTNDTVAIFEEKGGPSEPWAFALEFQTEPDPNMFGRTLIYLGSVWLEKRPNSLPGGRYQVSAGVINLTGTPSSMPVSRDYLLPGPNGIRCHLTARERYLRVESAMQTLQGIEEGRISRWLLTWIPLMRIDDNNHIIDRWLDSWSTDPSIERQSEILALTRVFIELSEYRELWRDRLKELKVVKSPYLESIRQEARLEGRIDSIIESLRVRFPDQVTDDLRGKIEQTHDAEKLRGWFNKALTASSLAEFRQACGI